jgi:hypothetical protein
VLVGVEIEAKVAVVVGDYQLLVSIQESRGPRGAIATASPKDDNLRLLTVDGEARISTEAPKDIEEALELRSRIADENDVISIEQGPRLRWRGPFLPPWVLERNSFRQVVDEYAE